MKFAHVLNYNADIFLIFLLNKMSELMYHPSYLHVAYYLCSQSLIKLMPLCQLIQNL